MKRARQGTLPKRRLQSRLVDPNIHTPYILASKVAGTLHCALRSYGCHRNLCHSHGGGGRSNAIAFAIGIEKQFRSRHVQFPHPKLQTPFHGFLQRRVFQIAHAVSSGTFTNDSLGATLDSGIVVGELHQNFDEDNKLLSFVQIRSVRKRRSWELLLLLWLLQ